MSSVLLSALLAMGKLDSAYQVAYGDPVSDIEFVEYYSLSCPQCLKLSVTDFPKLREKHPDVRFVLHPHPADLLTLQAMVCLEKLHPALQPLFLSTVLEFLHENGGRGGCKILQTAMEAIGTPLPDLAEISFLETTEAYQAAFKFLIQEDIITAVPSYEINGKFFDAPPLFASVEKEIKQARNP